MPELTHAAAADEIEPVALGIATEDVANAVIAHAVSCAECASELRSFYGVVTTLSTLVPAKPLNRGHSAGIKSRLLAKVAAAHDGSAARRQARAEAVKGAEPRGPVRAAEARTPLRSPEFRAPTARASRIEDEPLADKSDRSSMPMWIAVAATLIALGSLGAFVVSRRGGSVTDAGVQSEAVTGESRLTELERAVAEKDALIASLAGPGVRIVTLYNREAREPLGRMFWDRRRNRWTLFVYSLRQPRPGKTFRVWIGTDDGRVPLGDVRPGSDGTATFTAEHALAPGALNTVSISEEDAGSTATAPAGPVVLAGALR